MLTIEDFKKKFIKRYPFLNDDIFNYYFIESEAKIWIFRNGRTAILNWNHSKDIIKDLENESDETLCYLTSLMGTKIYEYDSNNNRLTFRYGHSNDYVYLSNNKIEWWKYVDLLIRKKLSDSYQYEYFFEAEQKYLKSENKRLKSIISETKDNLIALQKVIPTSLVTDINNQLKVLITHFQFDPNSEESIKAEKHFNSLK